ncbi:MerR family DNA-binding protein [Sinorhizobium meliloti]|uniref:MerR family transcriptional regulator n=1 Tax=Rhizobium meliloti TaxID=382 RepID=UPI0029A3E2DB|nr:MerR family DNA-binding protein [Sinorhizobium meliloti]
MQIGMLSRRTGVHIETIRFYERSGILPKANRAGNGRRVYGHEDVRRVAFIRHARELGFGLDSIRLLLTMQQHPETSCERASLLAADQLAKVEARIAKLMKLRDELARMATACGNGRVTECRVIEALTLPS